MLQKLPQSLGEALQGQRAGLEKSIIYRLANPNWLPLEVRSSAFRSGNPIPEKYTEDGAGLSPPLEWEGARETATSTVVIIEDADSPTPHPLVHAIVVNLAASESSLPEGALNSPDHQGLAFHTGRNSFLQQSWLPPDPPPGHGVHRYLFQVFALRGEPGFSEVPGRHELFNVVAEHAVAAGYLIGTYERGVRIQAGENADSEAAEEELPELTESPVGAMA